jgi:hypothetical protein
MCVEIRQPAWCVECFSEDVHAGCVQTNRKACLFLRWLHDPGNHSDSWMILEIIALYCSISAAAGPIRRRETHFVPTIFAKVLVATQV